MRKFLILLLAIMPLFAWAQETAFQFRILLKDKAVTRYSLDNPGEFLSRKALERRAKQAIEVDSTDLPVCERYVEAISAIPNLNIVAKGKWENFVTVYTSDSTVVEKIKLMPFVKDVVLVWHGADKSDYFTPQSWSAYKGHVFNRVDSSYYGRAARQIEISRGDMLHKEGFRGKGMTIAVIDAGFCNTDSIPAMQNIHIIGAKNFVYPLKTDVYRENSHGTMVLSCMGMNRPGMMVGTAPEADYLLLRSEDEHSEMLVEQDYWAAAAEYADSLGVDLINTSLGYTVFDDPSMNYQYRDLNGRYELISREASRLADKGIVLVCSAGNSGEDSWKKISVPADASGVLTVGAVGALGKLASFSSIGNTSDGRIKPDVTGVGFFSSVMDEDGNLTFANGTSFSSPTMCGMVACLWQACPKLTARQLIELVRSVGDRAEYPDNIYGYGIPDMWRAYQKYLEMENEK